MKVRKKRTNIRLTKNWVENHIKLIQLKYPEFNINQISDRVHSIVENVFWKENNIYDLTRQSKVSRIVSNYFINIKKD